MGVEAQVPTTPLLAWVQVGPQLFLCYLAGLEDYSEKFFIVLNCPLFRPLVTARRSLVTARRPLVFFVLVSFLAVVAGVASSLGSSVLGYMRQKPQTQVRKTQGPFHGVIPEDWRMFGGFEVQQRNQGIESKWKRTKEC